MEFTNVELGFLSHCLAIVSDVFKADARESAPLDRVAAQFMQQAQQAEALRDRIEHYRWMLDDDML